MAKGSGGGGDGEAAPPSSAAPPPSAAPPSVPVAEELPRSLVRRVVKEKLEQLGGEEDMSVHKDALLAFAEGARIFIHYLSATANDISKESKRQTISAEDVLKALEEIEFPEFVEPLRASLEEFRRKNAVKKSGAKTKRSDKKRKLEEELPADIGEDVTVGVEQEVDNGDEDGAPVDEE